MIKRELEHKIKVLAEQYPVITITGPRQAGKTTLAKMAFPEYNYCNLEHPETRLIAQQDPKSFFHQNKCPLIIDEIQRVPELLSYIQVMVDEMKQNGQFILTGSQQLLLNASISQSLAGRTALITLLPFSIEELKQTEVQLMDREMFILNGFLPRLYDQKLEPVIAYRSYLHTYVERDVRQLINVRDLLSFEKFLRILAGRIGQVINFASLANETGVSATTINQWLSVLEASYIIYRLPPYYENFGKRVIKSPKLYFVETGLACYLLGIENELQVSRDPLLGGLFENMVVMDAIKSRTNKGLDPNLFFFRDNNGNEIDMCYKRANEILPIEVKSSQTMNSDFLKGLNKFSAMSGSNTDQYLIYGGTDNFLMDEKKHIVSFRNISTIFS